MSTLDGIIKETDTMELQDTFYVMGIVFMSIMFILMVAIVVAIFAIKHKINTIQRNIEDKFRTVTDIAHIGSELIGKAKTTIQSHL